MHELGFLCSLDDFGAGFSSLGLLKSFMVDSVKLDRSFFLDDSQRAHDVVESIVELARKLGIETVAEGIEAPEQVDFLRSIGCDLVQGLRLCAPHARRRTGSVDARAARRRSHAGLIPFKTKRPGTHMCRGAFVE